MAGTKELAADLCFHLDTIISVVFTQINPTDPDLQYSFCLATSDDDEYCIVDVDPPVVPEATIDALVAPLNQTSDMKSLVCGMRQAFLEHL
jgi:Chromosome segregation protein Spc25